MTGPHSSTLLADPAQRVSWWRWLLRVIAAGIALWRLANDWATSLPLLWHPYHQPAAARLTDAGYASVLRDYATNALVVLLGAALLWAADGSAAVGLRLRLSDKATAVRAFQAASLAVLLGGAGELVARIVGALVPAVGSDTSTLTFTTGGTPPWWFTVAAPIAAAISEEVMLLVILFRALEWVRLPHGRTLAGVWAGIALLAVARCGYHVYEGVGVLSVIGPAVVFPVVYRRYRLVVPIIAVHALVDMSSLLPIYVRIPVMAPLMWALMAYCRPRQDTSARGDRSPAPKKEPS
jgi:membrane protease YdiL (CAAX protease family)